MRFSKGSFIRARGPAALMAPAAARHAQALDPQGLSREDLRSLAKGFGALLLAGLIWFVVMFHKWIAISLGYWLVSSLRAWLR